VRLVERLGGARFEVGDELGHQVLGLADNNVVRSQWQFLHTTGNWSTHDGSQTTGTATRKNIENLAAMDKHAAEHGHVRPAQVGIGELLDIRVDQALLPVPWKQGGDGQ
jgi:hypothetical protein